MRRGLQKILGVLAVENLPWVITVHSGLVVDSESLKDYLAGKCNAIDDSCFVNEKIKLYLKLTSDGRDLALNEVVNIEELLKKDSCSFSSAYLSYLIEKGNAIKDTLLLDSIVNRYDEQKDYCVSVSCGCLKVDYGDKCVAGKEKRAIKVLYDVGVERKYVNKSVVGTSSYFGCSGEMVCEKNIECVDKQTCGLMGTSSCEGVCE